jgi:hypothetical protein
MRRPPPPHPRGEPRTPGSGRRRGSPNRRTVQMRELMSALCHDVAYQSRLRADFRQRRVHPAVETLVWSHVIGKPTERVQLSADVTMNQKLEEERELFARLSIAEMEEVAAESEALVAKVRMMAQRHVPLVLGTSMDNTESASGEPAHIGGGDVDEG